MEVWRLGHTSVFGLKVPYFLICKGIFSSHLLPLSGEFSYSSIIFPIKFLIQFLACVFLGTGLFIIFVNIYLLRFLWIFVKFSLRACDIFSTHYFFAQGLSESDLRKPSFFYGYFLCIDIKSLCLNQVFCKFWSNVCKNLRYFNILHAFYLNLLDILLNEMWYT